MQRLRDAAEQAKIELSRDQHQHQPAVPLDDRERPHPPGRDAHRAQFEQMTKDLLTACNAPFQTVIRTPGSSSGHRPRRLVGGSTRMPAVTGSGQGAHRRQGSPTRRQPRRGRRLGAGLQAGVLRVSARTSCSSTSRRSAWASRPRAACSPRSSSATRPSRTKRSEVLHRRGQPAVVLIQVFQGEREMAAEQEPRHLRAVRHRAGPARCRRSRSPSTSTPTASSTSPPRTAARARSRRSPSPVARPCPRTRSTGWSGTPGACRRGRQTPRGDRGPQQRRATRLFDRSSSPTAGTRFPPTPRKPVEDALADLKGCDQA